MEPTYKNNPVVELTYYKDHGYLFHGSSFLIKEFLEPRSPNVKESVPDFDKDIAVYATDIPAIAAIFSIIRSSDIPPQVKENKFWAIKEVNQDSVIAMAPKTWKPYIINSQGYVYVIENSEGFETNNDHQWKCKTKVKPKAIIKVNLKNFQELNGKMLWE